MDDYDRHMVILAAGRASVLVRTPDGLRRAQLLTWNTPDDPNWKGRRALIQYPSGATRHVHQRDVLLPATQEFSHG